jgi:hypothetical protein
MAGPLVSDGHELTAELAYQLWEPRGRPFGSPEVDWFSAERALASAQRDPKPDLSLRGSPWKQTRDRLIPVDQQIKGSSN